MSAQTILPPVPGVRVAIHLWSRKPPPRAVLQLEALAAQPYLVGHVAGMPDLHVAHGVAVGTVFATDGAVVPSALGGDLGCGVAGVRFSYPAAALDRRTLATILAALAGAIPVGDAVHRSGARPHLPLEEPRLSTSTLQRAVGRLMPRHLGTLGGGNHFIELDRDGAGDLWLLVHSGSRGVGSAIADHHIRAAQAVGMGTLPALRSGSPEAAACLADIDFALSFARTNREVLMQRAEQVLSDATGATADPASRVDVHHNFVRKERHHDRNVLVHRKGAIAARAGGLAIIPGSMGTASYVVEGLAEPSSFESASHGAGRVLTRREAREQIGPDRLAHAMRRVVFDPRRLRALVEEAPAAYRDIAEVLDDETDLVQAVLRLEPIAVLKG